METSRKVHFLLALVTATIALGILSLGHYFWSDEIKNNRISYELKEVKAVMPMSAMEGIVEDQIQYAGTKKISDKKPITVFRQWRDGVPSGLALAPIIRNGYNNKITLCIGIDKDGGLSGVRVISHNETQNLGDQIDQANSDWLQQFKGHSLANTKTEDWELKQNGGKFDAISGASITSRSVINVIHDTLKFYGKEEKKLYSSK